MSAPTIVAAVLVALAVLTWPPRRTTQEWPEPSTAGAPTRRATGAVSPAAHGRWRGGRRRDGASPARTTTQISSALALLALAYRSGRPTWDVLHAVADVTGRPVADDLRHVGLALRWGASESEAWASVDPAWAPAARAVTVAQHAGVPPGPLLLVASDDLRADDLERLEVGAAKVGVRLVAPLGAVLLPAFCLTSVVPLVVALATRLTTA